MRRIDAHKGDHGTVAVIGGSALQHGAPILAALAAEATGVDLLHVFLPALHAVVARQSALNFQVHPFAEDELTARDRDAIVLALATVDVAVVGPGIARTAPTIAETLTLIDEVSCPLVIDATALQPTTLEILSGRHAILTPHLGELERMGLAPADLPALCKKHRCTILLKGHIDTIVSDTGETQTVTGGNPGLTVGGTGDALAGCIAGFVAQGLTPLDACLRASRTIKRAGDLLQSTVGYAFTALDVLREIPALSADLARP